VIERRTLEFGGRRVGYAFERSGTGVEHAVVCVHGITRNRHDFAFFASRLAERCVVYRPDLLGHGDSDWLASDMVYEKELFLAQLVDLMTSIGARRLGFVGTSYGGLMGIRLAAVAGSPISCLVLNDAGVGIRKEFYQDTARRIARYPLFGSMKSAESWIKLLMANAGPLSSEAIADLARRSVKPTSDGDFVPAYDKELPRVWLGNHNRSPEPWSLWEAIRCPVLVVRGARSDVLTGDVVAEMKRRKPTMTLVEIEEAGHFPHLMDRRQTEPIEEWLSAHLWQDRST
jgi:pimeloyl-ACP methyl ester carboxylesterase